MVLSETTVCNMALAEFGGGRIAAIGVGALGRNCKTVYEAHRNEVLEAYPWRCAKGRAILSRSSVDPLFGYSYAYNLPNDCLKPLRLENPLIEYVVEEGKLLTNSNSEIQLHYTKELTNAALFDQSFASALAARMAAPLAIMVKQSRTLSGQMWDLYLTRIPELKQVNEADNERDTVPEMPDSYYNAR